MALFSPSPGTPGEGVRQASPRSRGMSVFTQRAILSPQSSVLNTQYFPSTVRRVVHQLQQLVGLLRRELGVDEAAAGVGLVHAVHLAVRLARPRELDQC